MGSDQVLYRICKPEKVTSYGKETKDDIQNIPFSIDDELSGASH